MTTLELEQVIRDYLMDFYHKQYIGKIVIEKLNPIGYHVALGMDVPNKPIIICAELDDEHFIKYIKEDLRNRNFHLKDWGELNLTYPYDCGPRNTQCGCNDKGRIN